MKKTKTKHTQPHSPSFSNQYLTSSMNFSSRLLLHKIFLLSPPPQTLPLASSMNSASHQDEDWFTRSCLGLVQGIWNEVEYACNFFRFGFLPYMQLFQTKGDNALGTKNTTNMKAMPPTMPPRLVSFLSIWCFY